MLSEILRVSIGIMRVSTYMSAGIDHKRPVVVKVKITDLGVSSCISPSRHLRFLLPGSHTTISSKVNPSIPSGPIIASKW